MEAYKGLSPQEIEEEVLKEADARILTHRTGEITIRVLGTDGQPLKGVRLHPKLKKHDFLFGSNIFGFGKMETEEANEAYLRAFAGVFNFATLPFYWKGYELEKGKPDFQGTEAILKWCQEKDILPKGHPLAWRHEAAIPDWLPVEPELRMALLRDRIEKILKTFQGRIGIWDVYNEPIHCALIRDAASDPYKPAPIQDAIDEICEVLSWIKDTEIPGSYIVNKHRIIKNKSSS